MRVAISGVSRGIGEGLAKAVLAAGGAVLAFGRKEPSWRNQYEGRFSFFPCDMADPNALQQACSAVREPIDVLVCNAATFANNAWTAESFTPEALAHPP